jgi:polyferredoxin
LPRAIQYGFLAICLIIGIQFYFWYRYFATGGNSIQVPRPAGAEGFLPLSALIGLKYWLLTGVVNNVHPASLAIFLAVITVSLVFKKSFCSFICPIGLISEWHWMLGRRLLGRKFVAPFGWKPPAWVDYPLRSLKYLLLFFFVKAILIGMNTDALKSFIESPYNKIADVKMLLFFIKMSSLAFGIILLLMVASLFISNFWCRYLCPYGGLLGLLSFLSPVKIRRQAGTCTDCLACTRACPAMIKVHQVKVVRSDECTNCLECVRVCPVENTLFPAAAFAKRKVSPRAVALGVLAIFLAFYIGGRISGHWTNNISEQDYIYHIQYMDGLEYNHLR